MKFIKSLVFVALLFIGGQQVYAETQLDEYGVKNAVAVEQATEDKIEWIELQSQTNIALKKLRKLIFHKRLASIN